MNGFTRWMMKHPTPAKLLFCIPILLAIVVISAVGTQPPIITFIFGFIMLLFVIISVDACYVSVAQGYEAFE